MKLTPVRMAEIEKAVNTVEFKSWEVAQMGDFLNVVAHYGGDDAHIIEAVEKIREFIEVAKGRSPYCWESRPIILSLLSHIQSEDKS